MRRFAVLVAVAGSLGGCGLGWDRPMLTLEVPSKFSGSATRGSATVRSDWWKGFGSTELSTLVASAQLDNFDLAAAAARIRAADAQLQIAGSALLPLISASGNASRSYQGGSGGTYRTQISLGPSASYEIDFWGANQASVSAASANALSSRYARETLALSTVAAVADGYITLLTAQERLAIAQENVASARRILDAINARLAVGTATALDVAQQESVLNNQRATIPPLQQIIRQSNNAIALLIGRPPENVTIRGGRVSNLRIPVVSVGLPSELLLRRPDIGQAEAALAAADANVVIARAAFFPSVRLTAQGGVQSAALKSLFGPAAVFGSIAAGLAQPLFDPSLQGQLDLQKARYDEQLQLYRKSVISAFVDVENALAAIRSLAEQERLQREAAGSARRAFQIAEARLREGTIDIVTVLNTQQTLFQAQGSLVQVRQARLLAVVDLHQALGGGWSSADVTATTASLPDVAPRL